MQGKNTLIDPSRQLLYTIFLIAAIISGLTLVPAVYASNWTEHTTSDFSDGYFFHTTSTIDTNDVRISAWNDWMSDQWQARRKIIINNTNNNAVDLVNYQIDLMVNTKELIDSSRMRQDMNDIRFTDEDGKTFIPYYIQNSSGTATKITVKVPSVSMNLQRVIYLYYGNAASTYTLSNVQSVYDLYEDWESGTTIDDKWNSGDSLQFQVTTSSKYAGNYSIQSGTLDRNQVSYLSVSINT